MGSQRATLTVGYLVYTILLMKVTVTLLVNLLWEAFTRRIGLPRWFTGQVICLLCRRWRRHGFNSWVGKIPWRRTWQPTPLFLLDYAMDKRSLVGSMRSKESDTPEAIEQAHIGLLGLVMF